MLLLNLGSLVLAMVALVHGQSMFHLTPNIAAVEQDIEAGQQLCSLADLQNAIGIPSPFSLQVKATSNQASNGLRRQKLSILYNGILVRIVKLQASIDENDCYTGAVSGYYPINFPVAFDTVSTRTDAELRSTIISYMNTNDVFPPFLPAVTDSLLENFHADKQIEIDVATGVPTLVYFFRGLVDVGDPTGAYIKYPRGLIKVSDLSTLKIELIVLKESNGGTKCPKAMGGNEKFPGNVYGPGSHRICLNAKKIGKMCEYRNDDVIIMTTDNSFDRDTAEVFSFKCSKGPQDEINGGFSPTSDAFYFSQVFKDVLNHWGGVSETRSEPLKLFVHFGDQYPNSFYDGKTLTFGDGSINTYPITVQEIIGHELGHSLTDDFGNLEVSVESIALNEAFSDICGKAISFFEGEETWTLGKRFPRVDTALRYLDNPPLDGLAIDKLSDFDPSKGVYSLMGIFLKFMYTLVTVEDMSFRNAFQAFVYANQIYWNEESSLVDGACGILRAASDLGLDTQAVRDAFSVVEIDLCFCDLNGTQDIITYQPGNNKVFRHPIVSESKNPTYVIRPTNGASVVQVKLNDGCAATIFSIVNGNKVYYNSNAVVFSLGSGDLVVGVTSDEEEPGSVELRFKFN